MKLRIKEIKINRSDESTRRFRKDFGDIQKLANSLKEHGLIEPIVIDQTDGSYTLVAGERRITAALMNGWTEIDVVMRENLSSLEQKLLELEENIQRKDVTWEEQASATAQLHELKTQQYGEKTRSPSLTSTGWSQEDTAKFLGASTATVSLDIQLAKDLASDETLRDKIRGMGKAEARKLVEREKRAKKMQDQLLRKEITLTTDLILGDCTKLITALPDESVSCLITDPPFGIDAIMDVESGGLSGKYAGESNVMYKDDMFPVYDALIPELRRVMVPGAHFYIFFGIDWYQYLIEKLKSNGFNPHPVPLIWAKRRSTMIPNPYHYVPSYEFILFGCKEPQNRTLAKPRSNCLLDWPAVAPGKRVHSLQKPPPLIEMMITNSTVPGETVLDCFAGSAVVLKVSKMLGRKSIGFEMDEGNFYAAQEWLLAL